MTEAARRFRGDDLLLAVETSCDETAAAIVDRRLNVLSNVVSSQVALHEPFGGVVPEIASRAHVERILPVIDEALSRAGARLENLSGIAVVNEPGLVGSLLVGLTAAKTLCLAVDLPLVAVNHVEAHIYACRMSAGRDVFPAIGLVVSGGHSVLYECASAVEFRLLGSTVDDAAGEAFDKVAKILNLGFPGGPAIEQAAQDGNPRAFRLPRAFLRDDRLEFSFSGLKTAVLYEVNGTPGSSNQPTPLTDHRRADIAASFQEAIVDVLVEKCRQALLQFDRRTLCVGGGVAANSRLRERLEELASRMGVDLFIPAKEFCTDNAAMSALGWEHLERGRTASFDLDATARPARRR